MIEASSPLAAMQPPAFGMDRCGGAFGRADAPSTYLALAAATTFATNNFNFRDLSMKKAQPDYFSLKPVRGSSPTASLAADLSQNFHIDQSPQLPTPRRSLFTSGNFAHEGPRSLTTPPITSSSPGTIDSMDVDLDISPLPHKIPFSASAVQLQSPTPEPTPSTTPMMPPSLPAPAPFSLESIQCNVPQDRRNKGLLRPTLTKAKCFSTGVIPRQNSRDSELPPFRFGNGNFSNKPATSSSLSLSEIFESSPTQERPTPRAAVPAFAAPRSRPGLVASGVCSSRNGSPISNHSRKSSNPLIRPRKQFRRSLSMFEHPEDVMRQEKERLSPPPTLLPSIMDVESPLVLSLPHFTPEDETGSLPRITKETMISVLDGHYDHLYEKRVVIDCRFEYEYDGGHVEGAVNFNDKETLAAQLFDIEPTSRALLIFHCEYSAHRAPLMAKFIRNRDRFVNADSYPTLTYPEAYILDGGYSTFFKSHRSRCYPQNYVEMHAKEHVVDCERGLGKVKQRSKLVRAQTFAFGQHSPSVDSSPTAMSRSPLDSEMDLDMGMDYTPVAVHRAGFDVLRRNHRMLSY